MINNESVVIEGVHLNMKFIKSICAKYTFVIPFFVYIENSDKHKQRFFVRSKNMTLDPKKNKYVGSFDFIRAIQQYIVNNAENNRIPLLNNSNVDKSLQLLQQTILKSLREVLLGKEIYNKSTHSFIALNEIYKKISSKLLSSDQANLILVNSNTLDKRISNDENKSILESKPKKIAVNINSNLNINKFPQEVNSDNNNNSKVSNKKINDQNQNKDKLNTGNPVSTVNIKENLLEKKVSKFNEYKSDDENKKKKDITRESKILPSTRRETFKSESKNDYNIKDPKNEASKKKNKEFFSSKKSNRNFSEASLKLNSSSDSKSEHHDKKEERQIIDETDDDVDDDE